MPSARKKAAKTPSNTSKADPQSQGHAIGPQRIPISSFISLVAVHTTLLAFSALYLPRTAFLSEATKPGVDESQLTSRDRPQHPFLEPLTLSPAVTLASLCVGAAILQPWWAGSLRDWWITTGLVGSQDEKKAEKAQYSRNKFIVFRNALFATLTASGVLHILLILFGAPITSLKLKTYLLAVLLSFLTVYPTAYVWGVPALGQDPTSIIRSWVWLSGFSPRKPIERALMYPIFGTLLGGWLGAIPIALDWDRPWQAWPLTPAYGAIIGYIIGSLVALTVSTLEDAAQEYRQTQFTAAQQKSE